ncbi:MAG TPA: biotin--[acetyl-CoA-carboxylase] ligase [Acetobacteraceae bacterium]|nr:biotin--[acetyl-CoA-carboxylase] ligase [Acetobacteraceae bacterium]
MFDVRHYETIDSTNDEIRRLMAAGAGHGTVVHADEQTAGRGRLSRVWVSRPGNLYMSILLQPDVPVARRSELSFVAAIAVADTVRALLPKQARAMLKWPNDVLVDGAKIAGILLEQIGDATIIGIGLDVLHAPSDVGYKTTSIAASGGIATVDGARDILLARLEQHLQSWQQDGFAVIREAWLDRSYPIGARLRISVQGATFEGDFAGLDPDGALLLDDHGERRRIVAGDVGAA